MKPLEVDREQVEHLAALASLSLSEDEAETAARELGAILAYVEELGQVDTSGVAVDAHDGGYDGSDAGGAAWREDVVVTGLTRAEALGAAARTTEEGFAVPGFVPGSPVTNPRGPR